MVADPTPLTVANLKALSQWADLLLTEGTTTTSGQPRVPMREGWRDILGLAPPELRVLTTDLAGGNKWVRQRIQRDSAAAVIGMLPPDRPVLLVDSDELLDSEAILHLLAEPPDSPVRLGLVPLYAAVDRTARSIHCCFLREGPDLRRARPARDYVVAAPALARAIDVQSASPTTVRFSSPLYSKERTFGMHATLTESVAQVQWKLANMRHIWDARVLSEQHLQTVLSAGVHHSGWWVADYREPEPWLAALADSSGLRVAGPMLADDHLRALRAWAEIRVDPGIPQVLVDAGDAYMAQRPQDARDFFPALDDYLLTRPVTHSGHAEGDPGFLAHDSTGGCEEDSGDAAQ